MVETYLLFLEYEMSHIQGKRLVEEREDKIND